MTLKHGGTPHQRRCTQTYRKTRSTGGKEAAKTPTLSPKQITETTTCLSLLCLKLGLSRVEKRRYLDNSDWKWTKQVAESQLIKPACSLIRNELFDQHKHCATTCGYKIPSWTLSSQQDTSAVKLLVCLVTAYTALIRKLFIGLLLSFSLSFMQFSL